MEPRSTDLVRCAQGGDGLLSGDSSRTAWADWAVAFLKYCDGGSWTGTRSDPEPARNGSTGPLFYRGHYNLIAQLEALVQAFRVADGQQRKRRDGEAAATSSTGASVFDQVVLSGCSAGGMACYLKCDFVAAYFRDRNLAAAPVKCMCDAGMFLDVETVTGAGNVMATRYAGEL